MMVKYLAYYQQCFAHLSVNKKGGQLAPHKPLQFRNALSPMEVTGNEIPPKVTDSGMVMSPVGLLLDGYPATVTVVLSLLTL